MQETMSTPIDISNINEKIYDFLKDRIVNLTYPPGHKVDVRQLKDELGVSQTPIKDALFRLAGEGLVDISSRKGTYVRPVTEQDVDEICEIRMILETGAAEVVADKITDVQLAELERRYQDTLLEDADGDYRKFMERSKEFHRAIILFTGNNRLIDLYERLDAHMQIVRFRFGERPLQRHASTNHEHEEILNAFKERNAVKAKEAIKSHLKTTRTALIKKARHNG